MTANWTRQAGGLSADAAAETIIPSCPPQQELENKRKRWCRRAKSKRIHDYRSTAIEIMKLRKNSQCRFKWRPRLLAALLTLGLVLSVAASLYCNFVTVTLGFVPNGYTGDEVGVALWSFQGEDKRCQSFQDAYKLGGFSGDDDYSNWIVNGDIAWTIARCAAIVGFFFGAIALVCILLNLCDRYEPRLVDVLAYTVVIALVSEAAKLGLFFSTDLCVSDDFWYSTELDEYTGSTSCGMSLGAFICIGSIAVYFISGVLLIGYNARPEIDYYNYEENSLEELSVAGTGKTLSTQETSFLSSKQSQKWTGSQPPEKFHVEPILESPDEGFHETSSHMESHRRGSNMSSNVGSYSRTSYSEDRRRSSLFSEDEEEEEEDDYDAMQPLPQFHGSSRPRINARRMMDDDVSEISMDNNF